MNVPFFSGLDTLIEDPLTGMSAAVFYSDPSLCKYDCQVCPLRGKLKGGFLEFDAFVLQAVKFLLRGAEMFVVRGGEPTGSISDQEEAFGFLKSKLPLRLHTSGIRTTSVDRLSKICDGFCIDVKFPLKESYSAPEKDQFSRILPGSSCPYSYRDSLRETISIVDGMPHTYYTCNGWSALSSEQQQALLAGLSGLKSPIFIDGRFHNWLSAKS